MTATAEAPREAASARWRRSLGIALCAIASAAASANFYGAHWSATVMAMALAGAALAMYSPRLGLAGAGTLFLLVFGLFHAGLVTAYAISGESMLVGQGDNVWVQGQGLARATFATTVGISALATGYALSPVRQRLPSNEGARTIRIVDRSREILVGSVAAIVGFMIMAPVIARTGMAGGYHDFQAASSQTGYGYGTLVFGIGLLLLIHAGGKPMKSALYIGTVVGALLLVVGNRGPVIFTAVAAAYLLAHKRRIGWKVLSAGIFGVLGALSVLRQTRVDGFSGLVSGEWTFNPLQGIAEMGYSLYPVYVIDQWMVAGLEPQRGKTFLAVPLRFAESLSGRSVPNPDTRLFNVEVAGRVGQIGGSPIAESLRNGGLEWVIMVMLAIGLLLVTIDRQATPLGVLVGAVLLLPLVFFTRNSFAPVPLQWAIGLIIVMSTTKLAGRPPVMGRSLGRASGH